MHTKIVMRTLTPPHSRPKGSRGQTMWPCIKRCQCNRLRACACFNHQRYVSCDCILTAKLWSAQLHPVVGPNQKAVLGLSYCRSQVCNFTVCHLHLKTNITTLATFFYTVYLIGPVVFIGWEKSLQVDIITWTLVQLVLFGSKATKFTYQHL